MIKVIRGNPTPEELAAALAVVQARAAASTSAAADTALPPEQWADPARIARGGRPLPGPRAWARTYWPV
ncbi:MULTISPECIES: acyl-CoA carboxylase epsilon subunit [unclassified Streptomyces]|uniref:acyl-CoA carboxylase epsilon subunit n=1 Tax=unclassified Streptomyces TaxID=2593676 RepID=UPI002E2817FD|nr:acyl-CoA carboxylase epsilon subunit [Streptomyces sp. NBC_00690]